MTELYPFRHAAAPVRSISLFKNSTVLILFCAMMMSFSFSSRACSPLAVPNMLNMTMLDGNLLLDWESVNQWSCPGYSVEIEISCNGVPFAGTGPYFLSPSLTKTAQPQAYPQQTLSLSGLCPGTVYQFRARERDQFAFSPWSSTFTFTTPGVFVPPTLNLTASNNIICPPQSSTLNATIVNPCGGGPYSYAWSPATGLSNANTANPVASPTISTTYSVVVTGGQFGCWTVSGTLPVLTGLDPPAVGTASASPPIICAGNSTTLILSSFTGNIQWQSGPSGSGPWANVAGGLTNSFVTAPLTSGSCFRAILSSCTGTIFSNPFCVNVNQVPVLVPTVLQIGCTNTVATANMGNPGSSGAPVTVSWSPAPVSTGAQSTTANYIMPGVVTVTASFPDGCIASASLTILPTPPLPNFTITNVTGSPSITCTYPTISLTATHNYTYGPVNYFWSSSSYTASTQMISIGNAGTYTCSLTDPNTNCTITHTIPVYLNNSLPQSSVAPVNQSVPCGPGVVATATGIAISPTTNVTHQWYAPGSPVPITSGGQVSIFNPVVVGSNGTNTFVLVNNINGCSISKTVQVTSTGGIYPTFSLTSVQNFSIGCTTTSLTNITIAGAQAGGGGVVSYTILPPNYSGGLSYGTSSLSTYTVNTPGTYTVIVKDPSNLCETRLPVSIIQNTFAPHVAASAISLTLSCDVPSVTLLGSSANSSLGPVDFRWSFQNAGNPNVVNNSTIAVNINTATALTSSIINTFTLTVRDENNACTASTVTTLWQNIRPPLPAIAYSQPSITCITGSINLTNFSSTGILPNTFFISQPITGLQWDGPSPQEPKTNSSTYLAYVPGTYTMTIKDMNNGCTAKTSSFVPDGRVYPVISVPKTYSLDCGSNSLTITAVFIPTTGLLYKWNTVPGASVGSLTNAVLFTSSPGEYQIVATNQVNGCSSYSLVDVVNGELTAGFEADVQSGFAPLTVNFTNTSYSSLSSASITSVWSYGNGATKTTTSNVVTSAVYSAPGTYSVTMFAVKGSCLDTVQQVIVVDIAPKLEVPNVFTPNGDNSNDVFFVRSASLIEISAGIFDRWGNKIYELSTNTGNIAWDGKNQAGKEVPDGTYFYIIKAKGRDGQMYDTKGTVSLYR